MSDLRVCFDFDVRFANGGGLQGQDFRLDIESEDISDQALAEYIVADLRLLMVAEVNISNKKIIAEAHKRGELTGGAIAATGLSYVDLSHTIEGGMITY